MYRLRGITLKGSTLAELLVVMIVSGILFLLVFDGMDLIHRYNRLLNKRLTEKSHLLYSHQVLESILERSDSLCRYDHRLWTYNHGTSSESLEVDSACLILHNGEKTDTLFMGLLDLRLYPEDEEIRLLDSLIIYIPIRRDTLQLHYTTP
ncbi:MAG: hypothetical protein LBN06_12510 [Prevotellaceae bacterium]|jgi:hypothetical protein|nr:hypothetical protein [Prevotellaceae bacterium]